MLGFGEKKNRSIDPATLPIFVHSLQTTEAFALAEKVWSANGRYIMLDPGNQKELIRFVFSDPPCIVWLGRDQGRADTFELVLMWDAAGDKQDVTEVYVISSQQNNTKVGDDTRAKSLLSAVLTSPSIVPVNPNKPA